MTAEDDRRLADLLSDAVSDVEPGDRLALIKDRTRRATMNTRRHRWYAAGGAALAAAAAVGAIAWAGGLPGADRAKDPGPAGFTTPSVRPDDSPSASPSPAPTSSGPAGDTVAVPVYYVGDTPLGPRLFREFQRVDARGRLLAAARAATEGTPLDPDYRTLWGGRVIDSVGFDGIGGQGGEFSVSLVSAGVLASRTNLSPEEARLAIQARVYTLQGTAPPRDPVRFYLDSRPVDALLGIDTSEGVTNAPPLDVLALVNVTSPEQGSVVTDGELAISGVASSFEATVPWEIQDDSGAVVRQGFAMAEGWLDRLYPWSGTVDVSGLAPGDYTFVARTDDPTGGTEGPGPSQDTKSFTIE